MTCARSVSRLGRIGAAAISLVALWVAAPDAQVAAPAATATDAVRTVVNDYVGLYRQDS